LIKQLRSEYDFALITGPPVLPYSDVVVMAGLTDGVLLVARAGSTSTLDLAAAADKIRVSGAESLGVVVTNAKRA
jgi:Mrp family chromosome partitioning ATPase